MVGTGGPHVRATVQTDSSHAFLHRQELTHGSTSRGVASGGETTGIIMHGPRDRKEVALTFDACTNRTANRYDYRIAQILREMHVPATVFLGGRWTVERPQDARSLAVLPGIELGNHSYLHPHLTRLSDAQIRNELSKAETSIRAVTGREARVFRPPYGEFDERVLRIASRLGLQPIDYDLASGDPDTHATAKRLIAYVTFRARNGSIIVMHINGRGWHTAEALPEIIRRLRARGFTFVTVGEMLAELPAHSGRALAHKQRAPVEGHLQSRREAGMK
jgi:peptidoglycan/xylan/chitin deacetylase (PgdA/CDA1 family)